mgnify:CR=1 FL=1
MTRTRKFLFIVLPVAAVAGVAGWQYWGARADTRTPLPTAVVAIEDIEDSVSALGALQPLEYVDIGTQVSGLLQKIHVAIGDKVREGQLLAEIDPAIYQAKVSAGEAQLLNYRAQISERQAQRRLAEQQLKRQKTLLEARATSQDSYDTAEAAVQQVTAQIASLEAQIKQTFADDGALLSQLREKFQVRTYSFSDQPRKLNSTADLKAEGASSRIEEAVGQVYGQLRHLPLAAWYFTGSASASL